MTRVYTVDIEGGQFREVMPRKLHVSRTGYDEGRAVCSPNIVLNYPEDWADIGTKMAPEKDLCRRCLPNGSASKTEEPS